MNVEATVRASWGIIGIGHLASHLVEGLYRTDAKQSLVVSPRGAALVRELATRYPLTVAASNQTVVDDSETVILAVRPTQMLALADELNFRQGQVVISVAAGVSFESLDRCVKPATLVRSMPVISAAFGESPTCIFPHEPKAIEFFSLLGAVHSYATEREFEVAMVMATYYGWVFALMAETSDWLKQHGLEEVSSEVLVAQMTRAAAGLSLNSTDPLRDITSAIARPGSFSLLGLESLMGDGALQSWRTACTRVLDKTRASD